MRKFIQSLLIFSICFLIIAEFTFRMLHLTTDAPRTYKNSNGNINYYPNQQGYWNGGKHKWFINEMGYPGKNLPTSFDNLVLLIGDSYIQNFMNPEYCRQKSYLDSLHMNFNFMEVSMAGLNFLGYLEYSKPLDSLNPVHKMVYVGPKDFQTIILKDRPSGAYQFDLNSNEIIYPNYKGSKLKNFIYNFKYFYYLYRKNIDWFKTDKKKEIIKNEQRVIEFDENEMDDIIRFVRRKYDLDNTTFIFHPETNSDLIEYLNKKELKVYHLTKDDKDNWDKREDGHWSCFGHHQVALQVASILEKSNPIKKTKNE